eukprot:249739_1
MRNFQASGNGRFMFSSLVMVKALKIIVVYGNGYKNIVEWLYNVLYLCGDFSVVSHSVSGYLVLVYGLCIMVVMWRHYGHHDINKKKLNEYMEKEYMVNVYMNKDYMLKEFMVNEYMVTKYMLNEYINEKHMIKLYDRTKERGCDTKGNCREVYDRKVKVKKAGADKKGADIKENCREVGGYRKCDGRKAFLLYLRHNLIHLL